ncbi:LysR family transcriptional regulator [Oricola cellulosilytica]|uniref:LysR family transcriptional regulator n=1 Tax=Oricola cellulosilytica TaxID=1429082 RepID=A0A4R0PEE0_9HYPH|nr:LysR family transcriptional regulator [Oricola cellulosilytica]TCD14909.1 LysR family transcriptional regulator [Oricola cellulosilytica]
MNWDDVRYFIAVARTGRLTAAGRALSVDHATVSRRIRALEEALGATLFDRSPGGYALTSAGRELLEVAERMEASAAMAEGAVSGERGHISGPVRVAVPEGVAAAIVVDAAHRLCDAHPQLEIQLLTDLRTYSLSKREADIAITVSRPRQGRLKVQKIGDYKLGLYASRDYLVRTGPITKIEDLHRVRGIGYVPELIPHKELDYIPLVDPSFRPHLTSTSVHVQANAVLRGAGIAFMHEFIAEKHDTLVKVLPDQIGFTRTFWSVVHEDYAEVERIRTVSSAIVQHMRAELH